MKKFGYILTASDSKLGRKLGNLFGVASGFQSKINLSCDQKTVSISDARNRQSLNLTCGDRMMISVEGQDEEAAVAALQNYVVNCM